jgi:HEAT repeats
MPGRRGIGPGRCDPDGGTGSWRAGETFTWGKGLYLPTMDEKSPAPPVPGGNSDCDRYVALLSDGDASRRWKAAEGLARLGDPRALGPLAEALRDPDWRVRMKAAWALGVLGDPRAAIPLRRAMANPDEVDRVKEIIEEAMQGIARRGRG